MSEFIIIQSSAKELEDAIAKRFQVEIEKLKNTFKPTEQEEYLTRKETAKFLKCDISTIHNWCVNGKLKPLGIGNRVYFKRSQIIECLKPLN